MLSDEVEERMRLHHGRFRDGAEVLRQPLLQTRHVLPKDGRFGLQCLLTVATLAPQRGIRSHAAVHAA